LLQFFVNRNPTYGAGFREKPDKYPPEEELSEQRYHYLWPKLLMPPRTFLRYLHRAESEASGVHEDDTWLKWLPKKLNASILKEPAIADKNLAFGWGLHILEGPNHSALGALLAIGMTIAFLLSGVIVGVVKTQMQGFGVGSFITSILTCLMAPLYLWLQDT
jgi:hypothetical protein